MKKISIVIPVYNSEPIIFELNRQITDALANIDYELILINDQSTDGSWKKIDQLARQHPNIIGINLRKNYGQDNAIMAGLNFASGNYLVIMDDDLQHSPEDIIRLYNKCREGYDICYANFLKKKQAFWKNSGSWLNGKTAEILLNKPKEIYLSPFQIIHRDIIEQVIKYQGPYPYIQGLLLDLTNNVTQINVEHHKRYEGKSNFNLIRSSKIFFKLVTSFSVIPLRIATIMGFVTSSIGFILVPFYLFSHFFGSRVVEGWTTIVLLQLIIGGLILLSLGVIGEYIGRMYLNLNHKPQYNIKKVVNYHQSRDTN
ncbi:glycosyltransferase family 2 protein [Desulfococcaceae bacterium HSG7]|nr:glycosyltransferase family 2 protein [Desulfococcaceae bacterium HSG7]